MKYKVIRDIDLNDLVKNVNKAISDGWIPIGGICKDGLIKLQAMTKKAIEEK